MRRTILLWLAVLLVPLAGPAVEEVRDPSAVPPGTRGYCLTELGGDAMARVPVTVLGLQGPASPEGELVLIRLDDERFRETGIVAGMSGSPVYVNERLLGALAVGWPFSREPIAGVTPFIRMRAPGPAGTQQAPPGRRPAVTELLKAWTSGVLPEAVTEWLAGASPAGSGGAPLSVALAGSAPGAGGWLGECWRRMGWRASSSATAAGEAGGPVVPGAMIAAVLVEGDATLAAGGTVTEVRGDRVWAFGHPFLGAGALRLPLARARVIGVLPSLASSFKFFAVGPTVGELMEDRSRGLVGRLGAAPPMVPVVVSASGRTYRFRAARSRSLLPLLAAHLTQASETARGRSFGNQTLALGLSLEYAGGQRLAFRESFARSDAPAQAAALVAAILGYLGASPFEQPELESIRVRIDSREELRRAEIIDAVPDRTIVRPGDELSVRVRLRRFREGVSVQRLRLVVPTSLKAGTADLVVADGTAWGAYDLKARPFVPGSFADELRLLGGLLPGDTLVAALEVRDPAVVLDGGTVAAPPSIVLSLRAGLGANLTGVGYRVAARVTEPLDLPVAGAVRIRLEVRTDGRVKTETGGR